MARPTPGACDSLPRPGHFHSEARDASSAMMYAYGWKLTRHVGARSQPGRGRRAVRAPSAACS
jgi:hypothetical protein